MAGTLALCATRDQVRSRSARRLFRRRFAKSFARGFASPFAHGFALQSCPSGAILHPHCNSGASDLPTSPRHGEVGI